MKGTTEGKSIRQKREPSVDDRQLLEAIVLQLIQ